MHSWDFTDQILEVRAMDFIKLSWGIKRIVSLGVFSLIQSQRVSLDLFHSSQWHSLWGPQTIPSVLVCIFWNTWFLSLHGHLSKLYSVALSPELQVTLQIQSSKCYVHFLTSRGNASLSTILSALWLLYIALKVYV